MPFPVCRRAVLGIVLMAVCFAGVAAVQIGCGPQCGADETEADVHGGGYVCIPNSTTPSDDPSTPPTNSYPLPPPSPSSLATSSPSSSSSSDAAADAPQAPCGDPNAVLGIEIPIVTKKGTPAAITDATAPNGTYSLVQVSSFIGDNVVATNIPNDQIRATLTVTGAKLSLAAQLDSSFAGPEEFELSLASDALVTICEGNQSSIATWLLPGGVGAIEPAQLNWDAPTHILRLVVHHTDSDVELLFEPQK